MKYEMDQLLKDVYQQEVKPDKILNQIGRASCRERV